MGKRELIIIAAFVAAGIVTYQLAPSSETNEEGFTFSGFLSAVRREVGRNRASASSTREGTIAAPASLHELRVSGMAAVSIQGETRSDIAYELTTSANGPDESSAQASAEAAELAEDHLGNVLALQSDVPQGVRHVVRVALRVPDRLRVRIDGTQGGTEVDVDRVASVHLAAVTGDVELRGLVGEVSGTHRNGDLTVTDAGAVSVTLTSTRAVLSAVHGPITLSARNGHCRIVDSQGSVTLNVTNQDVELVNTAGSVRIGGSGGSASIDDPRNDVNVDVRRTELSLLLTRPTQVTAITTDAPLRLLLAGPPAVVLDAVADDGSVDARDFGLTPDTRAAEARLRHTFDGGTTAVALRNSRSEIVIARAK